MSQADGHDQYNGHAWLEYFLPRWAESELGVFEFARATPFVSQTACDQGSPQGLAQGEIFSAQNDSYPAKAVSEWAAAQTRSLDSPIPPNELKSSLYRPLGDAHDIRVLELLPGYPDQELRASLHHCSIGFDLTYIQTMPSGGRFALSTLKLEEPVWYTALSYTWGPPVFDATIYCDGLAKAITRTLETALKNFRHPTDSIMLWVDQICINQDDLEEKKQQIPLMSRIYTRSFNTVVWLGEADGHDIAGTFDFLNEITVRLQYANEVACPEGLTDVQLPPGDSPLWTDLVTFLSRPWFQRLWIIQEVVLSKEVWVMCGRHILPWRRLATPCSNMNLSGISSWLSTRRQSAEAGGATAVIPTNGWDACDQLSREQEYYQSHNGQGGTLFSLIRTYRNTLCWDPRDKIYGVLALTSSWESGRVHVDYTSDYPFTALYRDIAKSKIKGMQASIVSDPEDTRVLVAESIHQILVEIDGPARTSEGLPSWVPDWATARRTIPIAGRMNYQLFHASGDSEHGYDVDQKDDTRLVVKAGFVDTIANTTGIFDSPSISYDNIIDENRDLKGCFELCVSLQEYPHTSVTVFDALWRSMVAGVGETGRTAAPEAFAEIFSVLLDAVTGKTPSLAGQSYTARQKRPEGKGKLTPSHLGSRTAGATFRNVRTAMQNAMRNRRIGTTEKGFIGLFPGHCEKGDAVHIIGGCPVPYVMRAISEDAWEMIGECYVPGWMEGEALTEPDFHWKDVNIL